MRAYALQEQYLNAAWLAVKPGTTCVVQWLQEQIGWSKRGEKC